jgi:hypothetical protein
MKTIHIINIEIGQTEYGDKVLAALKVLSPEQYEYVTKMYNRTDRYKQVAKCGFFNGITPRQTAKIIINMDR